ncbi:hypothetical protein [Streptomyces lavendofoliae]|uniref:Uncharacterized protein n=1 Tax=Streptomyces lavendofoliae TaxID=67314 RepID=A0A918M7W3_9ACTN|nr:hypothetical protein [Streptomyces lavendofoliae]GGU62195.1 hypothetical protein GCM10010274_58710 [Streptomyces lavendofoliae]
MTDTAPQTPEQLLVDLGELHIRTLVSPQPKHPSAVGWQATAGAMAAGFARTLHALLEVAPDKAAEITDWFQGPFEEGPDPEEHTDWLERTVAKSPDVLEQWVTEGQELAKKAQAAVEAWEAKPQDVGIELEAIHGHFGLSYANYMVLPRTLLQSMPDAWQARFVAMVDELHEAFRHVEQPEAYKVEAATEHIVGEMTDLQLKMARISVDRYGGEEPPPKLAGEALAEWEEQHETDPTYTDEYGHALDPGERVLIPTVDPVPYYNRGRARVEPRLGGER